ncbi:MAG TPA: alkaline phosphatase family protein [Kofleriaceae bacterium]|nr:alkaline phosphatase family protein [Kofleriaceae bacterium]
MRTRIAALVAAGALLAFAYVMPGERRRFMQKVITWDAEPSEAIALQPGMGLGMTPASRVRVILIDGLAETTAETLPNWSAQCKRGIALTVDVGFPTVSLPVEVTLWTGLMQQQTGIVFRSDRPLVPPLQHSIAAQVPGSRAVAEDHGYIVRSLGFADTKPVAVDPAHPGKDADPEAWRAAWLPAARDAVTSDARLAFVHVLRVDTWGHKKGRDSDEYRKAASEADAIVGELVALAPDARWFLLSDHGHLPTGGHGGEERFVRQVQHCIIGPELAPAHGGPVHLVDISRAIADSVGVTPDRASQGRPLTVAMHAPLENDDAVPPLALPIGAIAIFILALGLAGSSFGVRRWWMAPWWFVLAGVALVIWRGQPTMSTPMVYARDSFFDIFDFDRRLMFRSWLLVLPIAAITTWYGLARKTLWRVLVAQLALPFAALAACITACAGWGALFGGEIAPVVPRYTAYTSALMLITAHGAAVVGLTVLARTAHSASGQRRPAETSRTAPSSE